jgi:carboxymethylenebutenolidase
MKRSLTFFLTAILFVCMNNADAQSCCKRPTGMQTLAMNKAFKASHEAPIPFSYAAEKGVMMQFPVAGGNDGNAFFVPPDVESNKVLIIFHEWWGLNDYIKKEAEKWQKLLGGKVAVYAVDLYDGKQALTPDEAGKLMSSLDPNRGEAIVKGLIQKIGNTKSIATLGWCMGGSWAFTGAVLASTQAAGCVMYYGFPEKDANRIKPLKCDILYIRGSQDNFIKEADVVEFENKVKVLGRNITMYSFDAVHAFANPSNPHYDVKATTEAQGYALKFLKEKLPTE